MARLRTAGHGHINPRTPSLNHPCPPIRTRPDDQRDLRPPEPEGEAKLVPRSRTPRAAPVSRPEPRTEAHTPVSMTMVVAKPTPPTAPTDMRGGRVPEEPRSHPSQQYQEGPGMRNRT